MRNAVKYFRKKTKVFQIKFHTVWLEGKLPSPSAMFSKQTRNCYGNSCSKLGSQLGYLVVAHAKGVT